MYWLTPSVLLEGAVLALLAELAPLVGMPLLVSYVDEYLFVVEPHAAHRDEDTSTLRMRPGTSHGKPLSANRPLPKWSVRRELTLCRSLTHLSTRRNSWQASIKRYRTWRFFLLRVAATAPPVFV